MVVTKQLNVLDDILAHDDPYRLLRPILSLSERCLVDYKALIRDPSNSPLHSSLALFVVARQCGRLSGPGLLYRQRVSNRFRDIQGGATSFLNASPESFLEVGHPPSCALQLPQQLGTLPNRAVVGLAEQAPTDDFDLLDTVLHHYCAMDFSITLGDPSAGYSSLRLWSEPRPDYVKIDCHLANDIHLDTVKREFAGSILKIARVSRVQVIAEGIELPKELVVFSEMGVSLVQGYLFGCLQEHLASGVRQVLLNADTPSQSLSNRHGDLCVLLPEWRMAGVRTSTQEAVEIFRRQASLNSPAILDEEGRPIGIVHRHVLTDVLFRLFAYGPFLRKPISHLMSDDSFVAELGQILQQVSRLLISRTRQRIEEDFIVTHSGHYTGTGRVIDALRLITEEKFQQARRANLLTLLPDNVPIQQCLERLLQQRREVMICYIDIGGSKPLDDLYGYVHGDEVLLCLAQRSSE